MNRLDRDTSGIVLIALTAEKAGELSGLIMDKAVHKQYLCLVHGSVAKRGRIENQLSTGGSGAKSRNVVKSGGSSALTYYEPVKHFGGATLLKVIIKTGRTHQIRAHMKFIKHPCVGDAVYGDKLLDKKLLGAEAPKRQMLHAAFLSFTCGAGKEITEITAPMPMDFLGALAGLTIS